MDADTKVMPKSLTYMVAAMVNDITIMGLCGETRIANKRESCMCFPSMSTFGDRKSKNLPFAQY